MIYDGHTVSVYDAATNTLYRYTPKQGAGGEPTRRESGDHEAPSVAKIEEAHRAPRRARERLGATPTDVGGQPAYTVRVSPKEGGSLIGGAELSFDAAHAVPLRAAVYSSTSSSPGDRTGGERRLLRARGRLGVRVHAAGRREGRRDPPRPPPRAAQAKPASADSRPKLTTHGHGISSIAVVEAPVKNGASQSDGLEGLPKVDVNGVKASELRTALGTILSFERAGVRYVLAGSVPAGAVEAIARGL